MGKAHTETELKILLDADQAARLRARLIQLGGPDAPPDERALRSIYYDTADQRLRKAGVVLRLRDDGGAWVQTVKTGPTNATGLQVAREAECTAPDAQLQVKRIPDKKIRRSVTALVKDRTLRPVCETAMKRITLLMHGPEGASVEVALDEGAIIAGAAREEICEAEMELKSGEVSALYALAADLFPDGGLTFSRISKSARGFRLAEGTGSTAPTGPRIARLPVLDPDMTGSEAAQALLRECYAHVTANLDALRRTEDPDAPMDLLDGLERFLAATELFRDVVSGPAMGPPEAEAVWLKSLVEDHNRVDPAADRSEAAQDAATRNRIILRDIVETTRVQRLLLDLGRVIETRGWEDVAGKSARKAQAKTVLRNLPKALDRLWQRAETGAEGGEDPRHALLALYHATTLAAPLWPGKASARFAKRLTKLIEALPVTHPSMPLQTSEALRRWTKLRETPRFWH